MVPLHSNRCFSSHTFRRHLKCVCMCECVCLCTHVCGVCTCVGVSLWDVDIHILICIYVWGCMCRGNRSISVFCLLWWFSTQYCWDKFAHWVWSSSIRLVSLARLCGKQFTDWAIPQFNIWKFFQNFKWLLNTQFPICSKCCHFKTDLLYHSLGGH